MSDATLAAIGDRYIDALARVHPVTATMLGIHDHDDRLGEISEAAMISYASELRGLAVELEAIDDATLSGSDRIDHAFLRNQIDAGLLEIEGTQWWKRDPAQAIETALTGVFFLMLRDHAPAAARASAIASRLRALRGYLDGARRVLEGTPRVLTETAITSAEAGVDFIAGDLPRWADNEGVSLADACENGAAALGEHAAWLRDELLPRSDGAVAVGEDLLARIVRIHHMLEDPPDAIAARGEEMIERIEDALTTVATDLGHSSWRDAVTAVKKDLPDEDGVVAAYADAMRWTQKVVRERGLATEAPNAPLEVRATPPFWRHTTPYAAYSPPAPFDVDQRGIFWVTPPEGDLDRLKGHARASIPVVALHEGFPGHHLQLTRANQHPSRIRRLGDSSLLAEGWAFYCEEMAFEQGLLSPESRLFQLKDELWRACRIVIDMRLHQGRMTTDEAVEMLVDRADLERPNAEAEVRRYAYTPGYQMAYAIGKQEILRLREDEQARLGSRFSLPAFHDAVLAQGTIPVRLIAEGLRADI